MIEGYLGSSSLKEFEALTEESISERENKEFEEGLIAKVKLLLYKTFGKDIQYLHEVAGDGPGML